MKSVSEWVFDPTWRLTVLLGTDAAGKAALVRIAKEASPDLEVIENPEAGLHPLVQIRGLHPSEQRREAIGIAKRVRSGTKVLLSTNSDFIILDLSNIVRMGERGARGTEFAKAHGYPPESLLLAAEVCAWLVIDGLVQPLPVNREGFSDPTIDAVIEAQN